jgi:hypothetical protein
MIEREPDWAANRFEVGETARVLLQDCIEEIKLVYEEHPLPQLKMLLNRFKKLSA